MNMVIDTTRRGFVTAAGATAVFLLTGIKVTRKGYAAIKDAILMRWESTYKHDVEMKLRKSQDNPMIHKLYKEYLHKPNSHEAHKILHTHYINRRDKKH